MPKNKGKGGKAHRKGKGSSAPTKREVVFKEDLEEYCIVTSAQGDGRFELRDTQNRKRVGKVRGTMKRKIWIGPGDWVLVSLREYQEDKCDIVHKYTAEEVTELKAYGEIIEDKKEKEDVIFGEKAEDIDGPYEHDVREEVGDSSDEEEGEESEEEPHWDADSQRGRRPA